METVARFIDFDFKYKWRSLIIDVLIIQIIGGVLLYIGKAINMGTIFNPLTRPEFLTKPPETVIVADFFLVLILLFGLAKLGWENFKSERLSKDIEYNFKDNDWPNKWIFNGKTETTSKLDELFIKSSRAGCLLKTHLWHNFRMSFQMKFDKNLFRYIGIVFRADSLDNYFMLEIFKEYLGSSNGKDSWRSGIKPHVRYKAGWEILYPEIYNGLDFSDFESVVLKVKDEIATLFYNREPVFDWTLPTHVDINHIESGSEDKKNNKKEDDKAIARVVQEIPFRLSYGMIGFRAHPGQGAIIKNLKIEPL